jgi:hypothetical protein
VVGSGLGSAALELTNPASDDVEVAWVVHVQTSTGLDCRCPSSPAGFSPAGSPLAVTVGAAGYPDQAPVSVTVTSGDRTPHLDRVRHATPLRPCRREFRSP